jgi:hypothetical protein
MHTLLCHSWRPLSLIHLSFVEILLFSSVHPSSLVNIVFLLGAPDKVAKSILTIANDDWHGARQLPVSMKQAFTFMVI